MESVPRRRDGDGSTGGGAGSAAGSADAEREGHRSTLARAWTCAACVKSCRPPVIPHLEAEVLTDRVRHHPTWKTVQTRATLPEASSSQPRPPRRPIHPFREDFPFRPPRSLRTGTFRRRARSEGSWLTRPPVCRRKATRPFGDTFSLSRLFAMSSDNARFVPGEAPNKRVGCTSSSGAVADAWNAHVRRRVLAARARLALRRAPRVAPRQPGGVDARLEVSHSDAVPAAAHLDAGVARHADAFHPAAHHQCARTARATPNTRGARHGADDCGREERKRNEEKSRFRAREKSPKNVTMYAEVVS